MIFFDYKTSNFFVIFAILCVPGETCFGCAGLFDYGCCGGGLGGGIGGYGGGIGGYGGGMGYGGGIGYGGGMGYGGLGGYGMGYGLGYGLGGICCGGMGKTFIIYKCNGQ